MEMSEKRAVIRVDASALEKKIGDKVKLEEELGTLRGQSVWSPMDGFVEGIAYDPIEDTLVVMLTSHPFRCNNGGEDWVVLPLDDDGLDKQIGDCVEAGDPLGLLAGRVVRAPFSGVVQDAWVDMHGQRTLVNLVRKTWSGPIWS